jgi:hypothetical protein
VILPFDGKHSELLRASLNTHTPAFQKAPSFQEFQIEFFNPSHSSHFLHVLHIFSIAWRLQSYSELLGFWTLSFVGNSKTQTTQRFGNWYCFCRQVKGEDTYSVETIAPIIRFSSFLRRETPTLLGPLGQWLRLALSKRGRHVICWG